MCVCHSATLRMPGSEGTLVSRFPSPLSVVEGDERRSSGLYIKCFYLLSHLSAVLLYFVCFLIYELLILLLGIYYYFYFFFVLYYQ